MKAFLKTAAAAAALMLVPAAANAQAAAAAAAPAAVAVVDLDAAIVNSAAFQSAMNQVQTTYKTSRRSAWCSGPSPTWAFWRHSVVSSLLHA